MSESLNLKLAEALMRLVQTSTALVPPTKDVLDALRIAISETTKGGNFEQLEAKVEKLAAQVRGISNDEALRFPKAR